jgi:uncharacterized ferritin-like protein (DUF455 family)
MSEIGYFKVGNMTLREAPARDACFKVVYTDAEMHEFGDLSEVARREMMHRHMTNEMTSVDMAAACVAEFPDAPWELRMELARQAWDEARHVRALHRRLRELGGHKGEFPISTLEWNITCAVDNLPGRIAIQNRTLEAGAMDVMGGLSQSLRSVGDHETADTLDSINTDEVQHVRFSNRWIKRLAESDRRVLMKVAMAIRFLTQANANFQIKEGGEVNAIGKELASPENRIPAVNVEDRKLAEFTDDEINEILRQAGYRSLVPAEAAR